MSTIETRRIAAVDQIAERIVALGDLRKFLVDTGLDASIYTRGNQASVWPKTVDEFLATVRILKRGAPLGSIEKAPTEDGGHMKVTRSFGSGVELTVWFTRDEVCTAKVVGQRTELVPDPDAPMVERTVDVIEYDCQPVLSAGD